MIRKRCISCGEEKKAAFFYSYAHSKDGLTSYCKECANEKTKQYRKTAKGRKARAAYNALYAKSERGREAHKRYVASDKGRATRLAYYKRLKREKDE